LTKDLNKNEGGKENRRFWGGPKRREIRGFVFFVHEKLSIGWVESTGRGKNPENSKAFALE